MSVGLDHHRIDATGFGGARGGVPAGGGKRSRYWGAGLPWRSLIGIVMAVSMTASFYYAYVHFAVWTSPVYAQGVTTVSDSIVAAYNSYLDEYAAVPGDDDSAARRWGADMACPGKRCGDGIVERDESGMAWAHLRAAGYLTGPPRVGGKPNSDPPTAMFTHRFVFESQVMGLAAALCIDGIPLDAARRIDTFHDDGNPATGEIRYQIDEPKPKRAEEQRVKLCRRLLH